MMSHRGLDVEHRAKTTDRIQLVPGSTAAIANTAPPRIPVSLLRAFVDALERLGHDARLFLSVVGLRRADLDDRDGTVSGFVFDRVISAALEECRVPNLGARVAAVTPIGAFPLLEHFVVTASTVHGALEQFVRYFSLLPASAALSVARDEPTGRLIVEPGENSFWAQYATTLVVHHLRAETEQRLRVSFVRLMCDSDDCRDLERVLGCSVRTGSAWSGVEFPIEDLEQPLRCRASAVGRVLEAYAADVAATESASGDGSMTSAVRVALASRIGRPLPSLEMLARQLAKAPQILQRRLTAEGVSYQQIVDETRRAAAVRLLADPTFSADEISHLLGYSEPSAFCRAFKRWHGLTPQEYRVAQPAGD
jgi:AraC-like DNA-binding protein